MDRAPLFRNLSRRLAILSVGVLLFTTGCVYDDHACMGATEKWVHSDINTVPKIIGTPFVSIFDSIISPFTAFADEYEIRWWVVVPVGIDRAPVYSPQHRYLSYAGSRVLGRSDMGDGYIWLASFPSIIIETVWFIVTGPVDLVTVLCSDTGKQEDVPATATN